MDYQIIVVGAGHAGVEAALAAARLGCRTVLITSQADTLGLMPCNPAIGGLAKSHLVFELDALGGEMAVNTDMTGLQFRVLNRSRGPAVQANRVQCDKQDYTRRLQTIVHSTSNLTLIEDHVIGLISPTLCKVHGVTTSKGMITADCVILTTGTALGGRLWIGHSGRDGGGDGRPAANNLALNLRQKLPNLELKRLKTGTPPRIWTHSIDFNQMERQNGETSPVPYFSLRGRTFDRLMQNKNLIYTPKALCSTWNIKDGCATYRSECSTWNTEIVTQLRNVPRGTFLMGAHDLGQNQLPCYFSHTNVRTHQIIKDNLTQSSLYGGNIEGTGVRYCPSIEDKVVKFATRDEHHVIIEPEGRNCPWVYPNGLSNSLPENVQIKMVRSIPGLTRAEFAAPAYAIEYDCIDTRALSATLAMKDIPNLFFAGQINGTTGYEEAAAQGFHAGVNAARYIQGKSPMILSRDEAYIGVMIDDLITKGTDEPYRMFTSRAERRLLLRQGNTALRLKSWVNELGILSDDLCNEVHNYDEWISNELMRFHREHLSGVGISRFKYLSRPEVNYELASDGVDHAGRTLSEIPRDWIDELTIQVKYAGYIERETMEAARLKADESLFLPADIDYKTIGHLRHEAREKLEKVRPANLRQAASIPGVNPADLAVLAVTIRKMGV